MASTIIQEDVSAVSTVVEPIQVTTDSVCGRAASQVVEAPVDAVVPEVQI